MKSTLVGILLLAFLGLSVGELVNEYKICVKTGFDNSAAGSGMGAISLFAEFPGTGSVFQELIRKRVDSSSRSQTICGSVRLDSSSDPSQLGKWEVTSLCSHISFALMAKLTSGRGVGACGLVE